jgi:hypothetical protein
MEKKKVNLPFPTMGTSEKKEATPTSAASEFEVQQEEMKKEETTKKEQTTQTICKHEVCLPIMAKGGNLFCGNCRKAIFLATIGTWIPLDREYPEEWEHQN